MRSSPTTADVREDADLPVTNALRAVSLVSACRVFDTRCPDLESMSICPDRRGPGRFSGARLCEPQHVESDRRPGFVKTLDGQQRSCGSQTSQTRAPLAAASPCCAVSQVRNVCNLPIGCNLESSGSDRRLADYKSAIRQIRNLRYEKQKRRVCSRPGSVRSSKIERLLECEAGETPALL
jgi:hypothetical protein